MFITFSFILVNTVFLGSTWQINRTYYFISFSLYLVNARTKICVHCRNAGKTISLQYYGGEVKRCCQIFTATRLLSVISNSWIMTFSEILKNTYKQYNPNHYILKSISRFWSLLRSNSLFGKHVSFLLLEMSLFVFQNNSIISENSLL